MSDRSRGPWGAALALAAALLLGAMPAWRWFAVPPAAPERYAVAPADFAQRVEAMVQAHGAGTDAAGIPVVRPPPGDVYLQAGRFSFRPVLDLEAGQTYRLHLASADVMHGVNFPLGDADLLLVPGEATVVTFTPGLPGRFAMQCSEYCGLDHNRMKAWVSVTERRPTP